MNYIIIIIEYILYVYMRHTGVADLHTHVTEDNGTKQGREQTALVVLAERACRTAIQRIANGLGDDGDGGRSSWERSINRTPNSGCDQHRDKN